jgi:5-formyltetrahydrofolate cyclo-ligase
MSSVKDNLRRDALQRRAALTQAEQAQKSEIAVAHLLEMPVFQESKIVAMYLPLKNELSLNRLLKTAFDRPCRFVAPRTLPDAQMRFHEVRCDSILEQRLWPYRATAGDRAAGKSERYRLIFSALSSL